MFSECDTMFVDFEHEIRSEFHGLGFTNFFKGENEWSSKSRLTRLCL